MSRLVGRFAARAATLVVIVGMVLPVVGLAACSSAASSTAPASATPLASTSDAGSQSAAPSNEAAATPLLIDRSAEAGYTIAVPAAWHSSPTTGGLYFSIPSPGTSAWVSEGTPRPAGATSFVIEGGTSASGTARIEGGTIDALLDSLNAGYRQFASAEPSATHQATIDGEPGWVVEHVMAGPPQLALDAIAIHGDRAYGLSLSGDPGQAEALRQTFDAMLAGVSWSD